jgi:hypothetical protein
MPDAVPHVGREDARRARRIETLEQPAVGLESPRLPQPAAERRTVEEDAVQVLDAPLSRRGGLDGREGVRGVARERNERAFRFGGNREVRFAGQGVIDLDEIHALADLEAHGVARLHGRPHHELSVLLQLAIQCASRRHHPRTGPPALFDCRAHVAQFRRVVVHVPHTGDAVHEKQFRDVRIRDIVNVHVPHSGNEETAAAAQDARAGRHAHAGGISDFGNPRPPKHHRLSGPHIPGGHIDHRHVGNGNWRSSVRRRREQEEHGGAHRSIVGARIGL